MVHNTDLQNTLTVKTNFTNQPFRYLLKTPCCRSNEDELRDKPPSFPSKAECPKQTSELKTAALVHRDSGLNYISSQFTQ